MKFYKVEEDPRKWVDLEKAVRVYEEGKYLVLIFTDGSDEHILLTTEDGKPNKIAMGALNHLGIK